MEALQRQSQNTLNKQARIQNLIEDINSSLAENSHKAYSKDWQLFERYCLMYDLESLPATPYIVAEFLANVRTTEGEKYRPASLQRFIVSIRKRHLALSLEDPTKFEGVKRVLAGRRRTEDRPSLQAKALPLADLTERLKKLHSLKTNKALRDSLLLILGFGGAFRRSELSNLKVSDITFTDFGFSVLLRRSKTDQFGKGQVKQFVYGRLPFICPVRILTSYLEAFNLAEYDNLFLAINKGDNVFKSRLSTTAINAIIKHYFPLCSAHSLRVGFVTASHRNGKTNSQIGLQTGQTNQTIDRYIRLEKNIDNNAIVGLF